MSEKTSCCERLNENTTEVEVFRNMTDFQLPTEYSTFDLSIRMQFPKFSRGFNCIDFKSFIQEHVGEECVVALGRLAFPNEWQMQVNDSKVREKLLRMQKTKINMRTCWISPLSQSEVRGHVHWLPTQTPDADVSKVLEDYGDVLLIERQPQTRFDCKIFSDMLYFALFLKNGFTMDDVPYFIVVNQHTGFVSIRGRRPICFHCKEVGHRKTECEQFRTKLKSYSNKRPGRSRRMRPRGKRFRPVEHIEAKKRAVQSADGDTPVSSAQQVNVSSAVEPMNVGGNNPPEAKQSMMEGVDQLQEGEQSIIERVGQVESEQSMDQGGDQVPECEPSMEKSQLPKPVAAGEDRLREEFNRVLELPSDVADVLTRVPDPVTQLQGLEKEIVNTLANSANALNEKIEVTTRLLCGESKAKKKKKKQKKK